MRFQSYAIAMSIIGAVSSGVMAAGREVDPEMQADSQNAMEKEKGRHCVMETIAVREGEPLPENVTPADPRCFQTFSEAIFAATGGAVSVTPNTKPEDFNGQALPDDVQPAASYVIGIEYEHSNYRGSSLIYRSNQTCIGYQHSAAFVGAAWNDRISSARAYSGCNHSIHYEHRDFGGASRDCGSACSYIGDAMNDKTSSIRWRR
jgi:hypothetical protein